MSIRVVEVDLKQSGRPREARIALAQIMVLPKDKMRPDIFLRPAEKKEKRHLIEAQSERIRKHIELALKDKPNFVILPELSIPWEMQRELHKIAVERRVFIVGGLTYSPSYHNNCAVFPPFQDSEISIQCKINPAYIAGEDKNVKPGKREVFLFKNTGFGSFATVVCYDFTSLDISKDLRDHGVNILFLPTVNHKVHLFDAIAIGNSFTMYTYICICNAAGYGLGNSGVYGPVWKTKAGRLSDEQIITQVKGNEETILKAELDISGLMESIENAKKKDSVLSGFISPPADLQAPEFAMQASVKGIVAGLRQSKPKVLVIGDVMLDHVIYGHKAKFKEVLKHGLDEVYLQESVVPSGNAQIRPQGSSPETFSPGGAAWLAMALSEVSEVSLLGLLGSKPTSVLQSTRLSGSEPDFEGKRLIEALVNRVKFSFLATSESPTICKNYFFFEIRGEPGRYKGIRMDREDSEVMKKEVNSGLENRIIESFKHLLKEQQPDAIVIDDYEKGIITQNVAEEIGKTVAEQGIRLFIDPKYDWSKFKNIKAQAILPNMKEALFGLKVGEQDIQKFLDKKEAFMDYNEFRNEVVKYNLASLLNDGFDEVVVKADQHGSIVLARETDSKVAQFFISPFLQARYITGVCCGGVFDSFYISSRIMGHAPLKSAVLANFAAGLRTKHQLGRPIPLEEVDVELNYSLSYFRGAFMNKE